MSAPTLLDAVLGIATAEDATTQRILDAAYDELLDGGIRRLSVEAVARQAGVARVTIYRRYTNRDGLVGAVIRREAQRLFAEVDAHVAASSSARDRLVEGFVAMLVAVRDHPLVRRTLTREGELVGALLATHGPTVIHLARDYLAERLRHVARSGELRVPAPDAAAELLARLTASFVLVPDSSLRLEHDDDARAVAARFLLPLVEAG